MKTKIRNSISGLLLTPLVLAGFALLPSVQAAPDPANPGGANTADGAHALQNRTTGQFNTAFGTNALFSLTVGQNNAAQGNSALFSNVFGSGNVAIGSAALQNSNGNQNTVVGSTAMASNLDGGGNTALGYAALRNSEHSDFNIAIGHLAGFSVTTASGTICIGTPGGNVSNSCFIAGIRDVNPTGTDEEFVVINGAGQLGSVAVALGASTELINKFETAIAQQQKEIKALTARLEEQATQIQKVSAQLEVNKPAPQMAVNNP
jgi:hypothetical protein